MSQIKETSLLGTDFDLDNFFVYVIAVTFLTWMMAPTELFPFVKLFAKYI